MKLVSSKILGKDLSGFATLIPEEYEDMWELYNIIAIDDKVKMKTMRKISSTNTAGTTTIDKISLFLTIQVKKISFDEESGAMRIGGIICVENPYVSLGSHHTLDIDLYKAITIEKEIWCQLDVERMKESVSVERSADIGCILMQDGFAQLCLLKNKITIVKSKIEKNISRKGRGAEQYENSIKHFFKLIYQNQTRIFNMDSIKLVLICSPGFLRESYLKFMNTEAIRDGNKKIFQNPSKFLLLHTDSGYLSALQSILSDPFIQNKIMDSKNSEEIKALNSFYEALSLQPDTVTYGTKHIQIAAENGAIKTLLLCDSLLRKKSVQERQQYSKLMKDVENLGGNVFVLSELHVSGQQLKNLTGVAAILRYPIEELENLDDEDSDSDE